ncbi:hypothetical protein [Streptomyces sp. Agncl-13]|uniref:hypothetical protein n=1 Tax=Streptomyces sp. Agncl-13 TaxID=3400628 RepID=UPI003A8A2196
MVGHPWRAGAILGAVCGVALLVVSACSQDGAISPKKVRELAGSTEAVRAREQVEQGFRKTIAHWDAHTALTLGLVTVDDSCAGGQAKEWFFQDGDDQYRIRCTMHVDAYFGADPHHVSDTIDGILTAGDPDGSPIPFGHDFDYATRVVDYYRGKTGDPQGPGTGEPAQLFNAGTVTLGWDQVRQKGRRALIEEPPACLPGAPPVRRCLREPASTGVTDIRREYGMVFKLAFSYREYFTVYKDGRTVAGGRGATGPRTTGTAHPLSLHLLSLPPVVSMSAARPASRRAAGMRNGEQET